MPIYANIMKLHQTVQKVVLEVKEVEANSAGLSYLLSPQWWCWWLDERVWISGTDEDQKKILKGLNLTIREGEAWKKKREDVDSDDLL